MEGTYLHYLQEHKQIAWNGLGGVVWAIKENRREKSDRHVDNI